MNGSHVCGVIQEVALARQVVLRHGHETVPWPEFHAAVMMIAHVLSKTIASPFVSSSLLDSHSIFSIMSIKEKLHHTPGGLPMGFLLRETQQFNVTIPHDRVYGILGLVDREVEAND